MRYIVDSYAWIEYLEGSVAGEKVRDVLLEDNEIYTIVECIAEIVSRVKRKQGDSGIAYKVITSNSKIVEITPEIANESGLFHAKIREKIRDFGLIDALIFASAKKLKAKILTGDEHFKGFKEAVFIK